ncbi:MAG: hypothetical protein SV375_23250, partial [Thermodesulfobacteriota bacterium]|nr:hypothetical protein [Thermodesulfobacteriota bacterium]
TRNLNDLLLNVLITGIERDLINGTLSVEEIEERWRADIIETFEVDPGDNDIHYISVSDWFAGRFGVRAAQNVSYLTAAQLYTSMQEKIMDFDHLIAAGEFQPVTDWLTRNIFSKAHHLCFSDQGLLGLLAPIKFAALLFFEKLNGINPLAFHRWGSYDACKRTSFFAL